VYQFFSLAACDCWCYGMQDRAADVRVAGLVVLHGVRLSMQ